MSHGRLFFLRGLLTHRPDKSHWNVRFGTQNPLYPSNYCSGNWLRVAQPEGNITDDDLVFGLGWWMLPRGIRPLPHEVGCTTEGVKLYAGTREDTTQTQ